MYCIAATSLAYFTDAAGVAAAIQGASQVPLAPAEVQAIMENNSKLLGYYENNQRLLTTTVGGCMGPTAPPTQVPTPAPCPYGEKFLKVTILTDNYPEETTWTVKNTCTGDLVMSGGPYDTSGTTYESQQCLPEAEGDAAYEFNILVSSDDDHYCTRIETFLQHKAKHFRNWTHSSQFQDTWGDGLCCEYGSGSYRVEYGVAVLAQGDQFSSSETRQLYGSSCNTTLPPTQTTSPQPTFRPTNSIPPTPYILKGTDARKVITIKILYRSCLPE